MVEEWKPQEIGVRFSTYIEELRDFFASRGMRFGHPEDLAALAEDLVTTPAFAEEMGSMVRSIVFSEGEHLHRRDLLALVAVAIGGAEISGQDETVARAAQGLKLFLDAATRQQWSMFAPLPEESTTLVEEAPGPDSVTRDPYPRYAPEPIAAPEAEPGPSLRERLAAFAQTPEEAQKAVPPPIAVRPERQPTHAASAGAPQSNEVLLRAVSMAAAQQAAHAPSTGWRATLTQWWSIPAAAVALAAIAAGILVGRSQWGHHNPTVVQASLLSAPAATGNLAGSCVASPGPGVSRSGLEERSHWAHTLLEEKLYASALPELRTIAHLDPGYPAIQLDESDALLNLKEPDEARQAVDEQINIAECLAKLPSAALDTYCATQYGNAALGACRPQLEHIRQAAQLQAALVHLELGHRIAATGGTAAAVAELRQTEPAGSTHVTGTSHPPLRTLPSASPKERRPTPLPPASDDDRAEPARARPARPRQ